MVQVQIDLNPEVSKEVNKYMAEKGLSNKKKAVAEIVENYFKEESK